MALLAGIRLLGNPLWNRHPVEIPATAALGRSGDRGRDPTICRDPNSMIAAVRVRNTRNADHEKRLINFARSRAGEGETARGPDPPVTGEECTTRN
jgi:hypothetical protein